MALSLRHFAAAAVLVTVLGAIASGQTSRPTTRADAGGSASRPADMSRRPLGPKSGEPVNADGPNQWGQWARTIGALVLVVVLIFLARMLLKRFGPVYGAHRRQLLDVLARRPISPRHQLLLVRMGRRIVLVGQGPSGLTTLSEVTDGDEVAKLIEAAANTTPPPAKQGGSK